jgi:hypothetical protein
MSPCILFFFPFISADNYYDYLNDVESSSGCVCPCVDSRDTICSRYKSTLSDTCYQPLCAAGYYRCGATDGVSVCNSHGNSNFALSTRGVRECIKCPAGYYCNGCDLPVLCPSGTYSYQLSRSDISQCSDCPYQYLSTDDRINCCTTYGTATYAQYGYRCTGYTAAVDDDIPL